MTIEEKNEELKKIYPKHTFHYPCEECGGGLCEYHDQVYIEEEEVNKE